MNRALIALLALSLAAITAPSRAAVISMAWSPVGNPGNAADPNTGFGNVNYAYQIGTYDVTVDQYVAFLNANDPTGADPVGIYNSNMSNATYGGVNFNSTASAGQMYSAMSGDGIHPINYVTWYDAIRFANWMDNGEPIFNSEPTATNNATENGSYTLTGFTATPTNGTSITRNTGAVVFLPSENEWYKAAYYDPDTSSYYLYPTSSNIEPNATGPTASPNSANCGNAVGNLTNVGAYSGTTSAYGAYDMGGNVWQWNEQSFDGGSFRGIRGGSFNYDASTLEYSYQGSSFPDFGSGSFGFRVAMVPEPSSVVLAALACGGILIWRRRAG